MRMGDTMRRFAPVLLVVVMLCAQLSALGCKGGAATSGVGGGTVGGGTPSDVALKALADAQDAIKAAAPDAVPVSVGTGGVVFTPPGDSWQVTFVSPAAKKMYRVSVQDGKPGTPAEFGAASIGGDVLASAVKPADVKIGAAKAYQTGSELLKSKGLTIPPAAMTSLFLIDFPGMPAGLKGHWSVIYMKGTSTEGARTVLVDAVTGTAAESK
jgi:hypothetical protein